MQCPKNGRDGCVVVCKKFSDEFNDLVLQCIEEELHFREIQYELEEKEI